MFSKETTYEMTMRIAHAIVVYNHLSTLYSIVVKNFPLNDCVKKEFSIEFEINRTKIKSTVHIYSDSFALISNHKFLNFKSSFQIH